ncbi:hypothetical protein J4E89_003952 [Alternaria sp. Ai002NY15]|nr:hypothetical protein J4E89_003952 [Alternaria sp. Ai002NY15]
MPLLDLPLEIFEEVLAAVAEDVEQRSLLRYRLICKTFANIIKKRVVAAAVPKDLAKFLDDRLSTRLFEQHGSDVLYETAMRPETLKNQVIHFIRDIVKASEPDSTLRSRQTMIICVSIMAVEPKYLRAYIQGTDIFNKEKWPVPLADMLPAIAAASGDIELFKNPTLTPALLLKQSHDLLPSALKAAIAADQFNMLERILKYLVDNVKRKRDSGSWKDMRNAAKKIGRALCTAIRLHKNVAGNMLFDFREENKFFSTFAPDEMGDWLVNEVSKCDNTALLYRVLEVNNPGIMAHVKKGTKRYYSLNSQSFESLYRRGGIKIWSMLLEDGVVELNKVCSDKTPLQQALKRRRYDIAGLFINKGASINSITKDGNNILWEAANDGYEKDVKFLLSHGADPRVVGKNRTSAISVATTYGYGKCRFLLEKARDHGKEYLERTDLWAVYETEVFDDRWGF